MSALRDFQQIAISADLPIALRQPLNKLIGTLRLFAPDQTSPKPYPAKINAERLIDRFGNDARQLGSKFFDAPIMETDLLRGICDLAPSSAMGCIVANRPDMSGSEAKLKAQKTKGNANM